MLASGPLLKVHERAHAKRVKRRKLRASSCSRCLSAAGLAAACVAVAAAASAEMLYRCTSQAGEISEEAESDKDRHVAMQCMCRRQTTLQAESADSASSVSPSFFAWTSSKISIVSGNVVTSILGSGIHGTAK